MNILKVITKLKLKGERNKIDLIIELLRIEDIHHLIIHEFKIEEGIRNA